MMSRSTAWVAAGALCWAAAGRAAENGPPGTSPERPAVAILHGTYDNGRHQAEHDAALDALGWTAVKYPLTEADRLGADLERYDLVLGNPLFNYGPDTRDLGAHAEAWRRFLERGGALVLTDCNYPSCVDWLARLGPELALATAPCAAAAPASGPADHPLLCLPNPWPVRNSWQHLVPVGAGWDVAARCGDGNAVLVTRRLGRGLLAATSLWPLRAENLQNVWTNLRLQRRGLAAARFHMTPLAHGPGSASIELTGLAGESLEAALRLELTPADGAMRSVAGRPATVAPGKQTPLQIEYRIAGARGPTRCRLLLDVLPQPLALLDRTVNLPPLLALRLRDPAYRGMALRSAWPGAVTAMVTAAPDEEALGDLSLTAWLQAPDGREAARTAVPALPGTEVEVRLPLENPEPGDYTLAVRLDHRGREAARAAEKVSVLPDTAPVVLIDSRLRLLVNGKPFFPLGMYHVGQGDLPAVAALGINTVQGWGGNVARAGAFLDAAQASGLKVLLEMGNLVGTTVDETAIRAHVQALAGHPALLAWYVRDEPGPELHDNVRRAAALFRELDPRHPTYMVSCRPSEFAEQASLADIFAVDPYPLPGGPVAMVAQWADLAWAATREERPVWIIPQAHDQSSYQKQPPERGAGRPTANQQRCMTWLALAHGARGLVWYTWDDGPAMGVKYHPSQQQELRDLCAEVAALAPELTAREMRRFLAAEGALHGAAGGVPGAGCLIVVNATDRTVRAGIDVQEAEPGQTFTPLAGGPPLRADGRRITLELGPLGVGLFRF